MKKNIDQNPGGNLAVKFGCLCSPKENYFGCGYRTDNKGKPVFWINNFCPIHGKVELKVK